MYKNLDGVFPFTSRSSLIRRVIPVVVALALVFPLLSCENGDNSDSAPNVGDGLRLESVRGMVLEVEAESLISLASLDVQTDDGTVWRFEGRGKVVPGFTPSHLNEHKLLGQSVSVVFYREGEMLALYDITD